MIIAIAGYSGAGKDAVAEFLRGRQEVNSCFNSLRHPNEESWPDNFKIKKFAGPLKKAVSSILGLDERIVESLDFKNSVIEGWGDLTGRDFLIQVGEALRNEVRYDIWVKALLDQYSSEDHWIISDLRYPNEFERVRQLGGYCIYIKRKGVVPAETDYLLDGHEKNGLFDLVVENNGSLEDLHKFLDDELPENLLDI